MSKIKTNKRHQSVTMESLDSKLDLVVEMVDENTKDVAVIKKDLMVMKDNIVVMKDNIVVMKGDIASTKEDVETIKIDIEFIKNDLKKKVDVDQFAVLERRVSLLEKRSR